MTPPSNELALTQWGTPSPEVTEPICRVPSSCFARAPGFIQPVHLCRIEVRSLFLLMYVLGQPKFYKKPRALFEYQGCPSSCANKGIPIGGGCRHRLRGRLTRTPSIVASKPVDFRRSGFGPDISLLMPAESDPALRHRLSTMAVWARALRYRTITRLARYLTRRCGEQS